MHERPRDERVERALLDQMQRVPDWVGALAAVYVVAFIAANMVYNAPSNRLFMTYHLPLIGSSILGFVVVGGTTGRVWAAAVLGFGVSAVIMHKELHRVFRVLCSAKSSTST